MRKGKFIVFEGIDGSGKTTQANLLKEKLNNAFLTAEPTKRKIGSLLRLYLSGQEKAHNDVLALLFASDRLDHFLNDENGVLKHINNGTNVLCDRCYFSSFAYQNDTSDPLFIIEANSRARQILKPDVHIFIDVKPKDALDRITANREQTDIFENLQSLTSVYENYFKYFKILEKEENILIVDGNRPQDVIADEIFSYVSNLIK